jgi:hypothetical protein
MRKIAFVVFVLCGLAMTGQTGPAVAIEDGKAADVALLVERIRSNSVDRERSNLASQLRDLILRMDSSQLEMIDKNTVDKIALMLSDNSESVNYAAAIALGRIGKPAMHAIPALLGALREIEFGSRTYLQGVDYGSIDAIVDALTRLNVCVPASRRVSRSSCDYLLR